MMVSAHCSPLNSEDAEEADMMLVDVLTPSFLFPAGLHQKDLLKECTDRLQLPSKKTLKLYYLIDTDTREQQNHRMALLVQDSKFSLPYVEDLAVENDLLRDRLDSSLDAFSSAQEALARAKAELAAEKQRRKAAEARLKELEAQLGQQRKRDTV